MASLALPRFLYILNIVVTSSLAVLHVMAPSTASRALWGGSAVGSLSPPLALPMVGSWWAAVALLSLLGLRQPIKFSPLFLAQAVYKLVFLSTAILPLAMEGNWSAIPTIPVAVFTAFLIPLAVCTPWGYLLGGQSVTEHGKAE